jgi:hypothetical protein
LLNETLFSSLAQARAVLAEWQLDYNTIRPHSSLGNLPPAHDAKLSAPASQPDGCCAQPGATPPAPLPHRAEQAQMTNRLYSSLDDKRGAGHLLSKQARPSRLIVNGLLGTAMYSLGSRT